ncbi:MAG TPA: aldehyde ferredoxin oxidoreductase C-terminal domain-containing protein, partial [Gemmataceae bacterium]|nr:aldehyde ferredoxin oxidoreductase C-terminal domain-containing protein [Gemmataceae bacterium]
EGWTPAEDTLPRRFLSESLAAGPSAGAALPRERLGAMIRADDAARGWDEQGTVRPALLAELRLTDLADDRGGVDV